jgi:HAMP domain-containing protein
MQKAQTLPSSQEKKRKRGPIFISLRAQLLVLFLLLFAVVSGGAFYWFYHFATDAVRNRVEEDMQTILLGVDSDMNGDQFAALIQASQNAPEQGYYPPKPDESPADQKNMSTLYWDQAEFLYQMRTAIGKDRVRFYTYIAGGPNEVVFIGSSSAVAEQDGAAFLDHWTPASVSDAQVILGGLNQTTLYPKIYQDSFGKWMSGYTPIYDSQGNKVGALGIDFQASYVEKVQGDVQNGILIATGITAILVIIMVFLISGLLTRPIKALTRVAERIGEGDYEQDLSGLTPGRFSDETGKLAEVIEIMVGKVHQREEKLKKQVAELQIVIDEHKRQEQVSEIVDSDFFRDLQDKARKMRRDFSAAGQPSPEKPES